MTAANQPGMRASRVAIVGAGPTGLVSALALARYGFGSILIEAKPGLASGSRALGLSRRTLDILGSLGIADEVLAEALVWTTSRSYFRGREIIRSTLPQDDSTRFPAMAILSQHRTEELLLEAVLRTGMVEVRWNHQVVGQRQSDGGMTLECTTPGGDVDIVADFVLACDGARSAMRKLCGLKLEGQSYDANFVIADIKQKSSTPPGRRAWFDVGGEVGRTALMHRHPGDLWRIDYQLPPGVEAEVELADATLRRRIEDVLAAAGEAEPWETVWVTSYRAHGLLLASMRHGRTLFAGDAAHILPIFGVKGLNTGVDDAFSLAWFVSEALKGNGAILDAYSVERLQFARHVLSESMRNADIMAPPTPGARLVRDAALSLCLGRPRFKQLLEVRHGTGSPVLKSPIYTGDEDAGGQRTVDNVRLVSDAGAPSFLLDRLPIGSFGLIVAGDAMSEADVESIAREMAVVRLAACDTEAADRLGLLEGGVRLVRPDHLIVGSWDRASIDQVRNTARRPLPSTMAKAA